jgi:hypothetical protein
MQLQLRLMSLVRGGGDSQAVEHGRQDAAAALVAGYEAAVKALDPSDLEERAWYQAQLRDARCAAGLAPVDGFAAVRGQH